MLFIPRTSLTGEAGSWVISLRYTLLSACLSLGTWYVSDSWVFKFLFQIVTLVYSTRVFKKNTDFKNIHCQEAGEILNSDGKFFFPISIFLLLS